MSEIKIVLSKIGKDFINKQLKGPALPLIGFIPFYVDDEFFNAGSNKSTIISYAMSDGLFGRYYFNDINYKQENGEIVPKDNDDYKDLFDLITDDRLFKIKYTNTHTNNDVSISLYNFNLNVDDIKVEFGNDPELSVNGLAIFIQSNIFKGTATPNDIELFGVIYFDNEVDLVKNDINWTLAFNNDGVIDYNDLKDENNSNFVGLDSTEKSNVHSANSLTINQLSYTFSDNFYDNAKTLYYESGWSLGFVKGGLNDYQYDLTLINDSANENAFYFNINPNTNTLEMQNTNRDSNIVFGNEYENYSAKNSFIVNSNTTSDNESYAIFDVKSNSNYSSSHYIFDAGSGNGGNTIKNSNYVTIFGTNNKVNSSNNIFIKGDNNEISGDYAYVVGDNNKALNDNIYIFGGSLSSNIKDSINFGSNYYNKDYSFVYRDGGLVYGLENDYGNFVINSNDNTRNIQFSKDSVYLMNTFEKIDPSSAHNSFLIGTKNVSSTNSMIYGNYGKFENSHILNSLSIASSQNTPKNTERVNALIVNSLDNAGNVYNVTSNNSILKGIDVSSTSGIIIDNSIVGNFKSTNGKISNSLVINGDISGKASITNSLVLTDNSKVVSSGYISNSIIQGNTQNSTFINSHLIGNLPEGVNKEFEDCLVIADGKEYVEIYADKIVKIIDGEEKIIPLKYTLFDNYMDLECTLGKEWKTDNVEETYQQKISNLLQNQKMLFNFTNKGETIFCGEVENINDNCYCSIFVVMKDFNFVIECYFSNDECTYDIIDMCNFSEKTINLESFIDDNFRFYRNGKKCYIVGYNEDEIFSVIKFSTCKLLKEQVLKNSTILSENLYKRISKTDNLITYFMPHEDFLHPKDNYTLKAEDYINFVSNSSNSANIKNVSITDTELNNLIKSATATLDNETLKKCSSFAPWIQGQLPPINFNDGTSIIFDGVFASSYNCDVNGEVVVTKNINPYISALDNYEKLGFVKIDDGINVESNTLFNGYKIDNLLYDLNNYDNSACEQRHSTLIDENPYVMNHLNNINLVKNKDFIAFKLINKNYSDDVTNEAILVNKNLDDYITPISGNDNLVNFTRLFIWGKIATLTIYTTTFTPKYYGIIFTENTNQIPILKYHSTLRPLTPVLSFVTFANQSELYPFNTASYSMNSRRFNYIYLNLHKDSDDNYRLATYGIGYPLHSINRDYINPFIYQKYINLGLIKHSFSYMTEGNDFSKLTNNVYNNNKNDLKDVHPTILREGDYYYT